MHLHTSSQLPAAGGECSVCGRHCSHAVRHCWQVVDYAWGEDAGVLLPQGRPPDVITGADIIYEEQHYPALLATLQVGFRVQSAPQRSTAACWLLGLHSTRSPE
jgi:hypothetical protein